MSLLIKNGTVVTAVDQYVGDVLIEGERIATIGSSLSMPVDRTIDASGKLVLPGGIDVHTHLDMPFGGTTSADDFESGTIAAAFGRPPSSISRFSTRARRCITPGRRGCTRPRARPPSTTAST